jgi:hypothetical protein
MYDGRNAMARKLADWWERHEEFDRQRVKDEERQKRADLKQAAELAAKYGKKVV